MCGFCFFSILREVGIYKDVYICNVKHFTFYIKFIVLLAALVLKASLACAQNVTPDKTVASIESMPRSQAFAAMDNWLEVTDKKGAKEYKKLIASLEEMLSEPTWDCHNEELFVRVIEHAAAASCLSESDRMRPQMLLDIVHKNAPGTEANDIEYETLDGLRGKVSEIASPYTLIYFNDPECLSCAKVKERLDTCTTLRNMVQDSLITVIGIYPYDNVAEWHSEPFPSYVVNGWDCSQAVENEQTYDLMTMPMFYLLDAEKRVILKNEASLNRVLKVINRLKGMVDSDIESKLDAVFNVTR